MALLCLYLVYSIVDTQIGVYKSRKALERIQSQIEALQLDNDDMMHTLSGGEEGYVERVAREKLGYAAPGERVFEDE